MSIQNVPLFKNKRILLLQGPIGPFFRRLADELVSLNNFVIKINFNAGDVFFYPQGIIFQQPFSQWVDYLKQTILNNQIDTIILFGDCRELHIQAKSVANFLNIKVYVFEEGYLRPNHITLEHTGVNGYSTFLQQIPSSFLNQEITPLPNVEQVGKTYWYAAWWAFLYYTFAILGKKHFPYYQHHRPLNSKEAWFWLRSIWRKQKFKFLERGLMKLFTGTLSQSYFLVPLQVYNDSQISHHSTYSCIEDFITEVITSFAQNAPKDTILVFKQHPFDRAYKDYTQHIQKCIYSFQIENRVIYLHDQHLPSLINHARGVVVINSTVGLSAVESLRPVKVCGEAVYNFPYITAQVSLDDFWQQAPYLQPKKTHVELFIHYLCKKTQHNGSFYKKIKICKNQTGIKWYLR